MVTILIILHVIICIMLILAVLLQSGKGAGLAGAFGGGGSMGGGMGAVFGGRGAAPFLSKATTVLAIAFMLSCLVHLKVEEKSPQSIIQKEAQNAPRVMQPGESLPLIIEDETAPQDQRAPAETPPAEEGSGAN